MSLLMFNQQFYKSVKDWWLFGFYFCMPLAWTAIFYSQMTRKMLSNVETYNHTKQVSTLCKFVSYLFCVLLVFCHIILNFSYLALFSRGEKWQRPFSALLLYLRFAGFLYT